MSAIGSASRGFPGARPAVESFPPTNLVRTGLDVRVAMAASDRWVQLATGTPVQPIGRRFEVQSFSRSLVEPQSDIVELGLRDLGEVCCSRVLPEQAVGVFVGAALPGTARVTEIDLNTGVNRELGVLGHLLP